MSTRPMSLCLRAIGACLLGATIAAGAACGPTTTHVYVATRPPAPVYEVRAASPGPGYVWVEGYHHWDGRAYAWTPGRWEREPYARATWAPGQWQHDRHGWYYVEGHWVKH